MSIEGDMKLRIYETMRQNLWIMLFMSWPRLDKKEEGMRYGILTEGARAFSVVAVDETVARKIAESCLHKGEKIKSIVELEVRKETEKELPEEKEDEEVKEKKAEVPSDEKGSGGASEEEGEKAKEAISPDPGKVVNGGIDEPQEAK